MRAIRHRANYPNDGSLPFFYGRFAQLMHDYAMAHDFYRQALKLFSEETDIHRVRERLIEVLFRQKRGLQAYDEFATFPEIFDLLASKYHSSKDISGLRKLIDAHRMKNPKDPLIIFWEASAYWQEQDYDRSGPAFRAYLLAIMDQQNPPYLWLAQSNLVRGLVRQKKLTEARTVLLTFREEVDSTLDSLIHATNNDAPAVIEAIRKVHTLKGFNLRQLFDDPDLGPLLRSPAMKAVRDQYPEPMATPLR